MNIDERFNEILRMAYGGRRSRAQSSSESDDGGSKKRKPNRYTVMKNKILESVDFSGHLTNEATRPTNAEFDALEVIEIGQHQECPACYDIPHTGPLKSQSDDYVLKKFKERVDLVRDSKGKWIDYGDTLTKYEDVRLDLEKLIPKLLRYSKMEYRGCTMCLIPEDELTYKGHKKGCLYDGKEYDMSTVMSPQEFFRNDPPDDKQFSEAWVERSIQNMLRREEMEEQVTGLFVMEAPCVYKDDKGKTHKKTFLFKGGTANSLLGLSEARCEDTMYFYGFSVDLKYYKWLKTRLERSRIDVYVDEKDRVMRFDLCYTAYHSTKKKQITFFP